MHPFVAYELSRAKLAELRREAERERLARSAEAGPRPGGARPVASGRIRAVLGGGLVRLGLRVAGVQQIEW